MRHLLRNGYKAKKRPSGHDISEKFGRDNGAAIPPNLIAVAHTESNTCYLRYCQAHDLRPHPARFPAEIPEFFVRMLTDAGDLVVDPFAGSCATGEVCERLSRRWMCAKTRVAELAVWSPVTQFLSVRGRTRQSMRRCSTWTSMHSRNKARDSALM